MRSKEVSLPRSKTKMFSWRNCDKMGPPTQRIARTAGLRTEADPVVSAATRAEERAGRTGRAGRRAWPLLRSRHSNRFQMNRTSEHRDQNNKTPKTQHGEYIHETLVGKTFPNTKKLLKTSS